MEKLGETIEQWEREVRDYEKMWKKALDEEIKIGVLAYLAPEKASEHLFLFNCRQAADVRGCAQGCVRVPRRTQGAACRRCGCAHGRRRSHTEGRQRQRRGKGKAVNSLEETEQPQQPHDA
eukprot:2802161-Amphidinium_carterae.1